MLIFGILIIYSQFIQFHNVLAIDGDQTAKVKSNQDNTQSVHYSRISDKKCKEYQAPIFDIWQERDVFTGELSTYYKDRCPHAIKGYILGGTAAQPKEFAHMALIGSSQTLSPWFCGGTLISDEFVLTAAHCSQGNGFPADLIRLGELDYDKTFDDAAYEEFDIIEKIIPEDYIIGQGYNDIALFKINRKVNFTRYIRPACLSTALNDYNSENAIASGWGATTKGQGSNPSTFLKRVVIEKFDYNECNTAYKTIPKEKIIKKLPHYVQNISQICYGSKTGNRDTCPGDSGGPLQIYHQDSINFSCMYSVIGVTSVGFLCGIQIPGLYTKVYYYLDWIEKNVWPNEKL